MHCQAAQAPTSGLRQLSFALVLSLALLGAGSFVGPRHVLAAPVSQTFGSPAAITGLWLVAPFPDAPNAREITLFTSDGFMFASNPPSRAVMPGEGPPGVSQLVGSQGFGLWQAQADGTAAFRFLQIKYDPDGNYLGYTSIHGSLTLDPSLSTFSGTYTVTVTQADGSSMDVQGPSPVTGTREGL